MTPDEWLRQYAGVPEKIDLGLTRCHRVLDTLDLRKPPYQLITVAGTNGKGSTLAFLDSILSAAGILTGRYSSPHLIDFNERILVAQAAVNDAVILKAFTTIKDTAGEISLSYFEYATIAALWIFAEQQVDVALLEVGLGGRLDAVNAVDADVAIITSIALDHQEWLGDDLNVIGFEKAGIMRKAKPCVLATDDLPISITEHAENIGAQLVQAKRDYDFEKILRTTVDVDTNTHTDENDNTWRWHDRKNELTLPMPALRGDIQIQNAAAAIAALRHSHFWPIDKKHLSTGLKHVSLPGRQQQLKRDGRDWILDVAHNPAAMQVLVSGITPQLEKGRALSVVFGMLSDKDAAGCIELLKPRVQNWYITPLDSPRSLSLEALENMLRAAGIDSEFIHHANNIADACKLANENTPASDTILVCGSFYAVGAALEFLQAG